MKIISMIDPVPDLGAAGGVAVVDSYQPRKQADVLELDMGDGVVLYDAGSKLIHHLNPPASAIWHVVDGNASVEELAIEFADELSLEPGQIRQQLATLVAELDALGLVENAEGMEGP